MRSMQLAAGHANVALTNQRMGLFARRSREAGGQIAAGDSKMDLLGDIVSFVSSVVDLADEPSVGNVLATAKSTYELTGHCLLYTSDAADE